MLPWQPFLAFYIWGAHWRHLKNTTEPSMCGGDAALCQITLTTCIAVCLLWCDCHKFYYDILKDAATTAPPFRRYRIPFPVWSVRVPNSDPLFKFHKNTALVRRIVSPLGGAENFGNQAPRLKNLITSKPLEQIHSNLPVNAS